MSAISEAESESAISAGGSGSHALSESDLSNISCLEKEVKHVMNLDSSSLDSD